MSAEMSPFEDENLSNANSGTAEHDLSENADGENVNYEQSNENTEDEFSAPQSAVSSGGNTDAIVEWREKRQADIAERDAADEEAKNELQEEAVKHIDDFYDNYNRKKSQNLETVKNETEEFMKKKDAFFSQENTTTWDRVLQLINEDDADILGGRDRSKFKEILQRLKGNSSAPGA